MLPEVDGQLDTASTSLPFQTAPHDALREGLCSLKSDAAPVHPVEKIQRQGAWQPRSGAQQPMLAQLYGSALPARQHIERQLLSRVQRLPGLPSSHLGLHSLTGELDDFSFEAYLGNPADSETAPPPLHAVMDARLAGSSGAHLRGLP